MMSLSSSDSTTFKFLRKAVMEHSGHLREKLSKFVRGCLKHGLHNQDVIATLSERDNVGKKASICNLAEEKDRLEEKGLRVPLVHLRAEETDLFHSTTLLRMLVSHSKYPSLLEESKPRAIACPVISFRCCIVS